MYASNLQEKILTLIIKRQNKLSAPLKNRFLGRVCDPISTDLNQVASVSLSCPPRKIDSLSHIAGGVGNGGIMGRVRRVAQFWRSFLVVSVPLAALPLLFVRSEEKVNIAQTTTTTVMTTEGRADHAALLAQSTQSIVCCQLGGLLR